MEIYQRGTPRHIFHRCRASIHGLNQRISEAGVTLIELLATLTIAVVISSIIIYTLSFEFKSWNTVIPKSDLISNVSFLTQHLQVVFQNVSTLTPDPNYPAGTAMTGTDANGNTVEIRLQQVGTDHVVMFGSTPLISMVVSDTLGSGGTTGPLLVPNTVYFLGGTSFAGSTFSISGKLVTAQLKAVYELGTGNSISEEMTDNFALGGSV
jgi:Tfp pilus assembly protein PilE